MFLHSAKFNSEVERFANKLSSVKPDDEENNQFLGKSKYIARIPRIFMAISIVCRVMQVNDASQKCTG